MEELKDRPTRRTECVSEIHSSRCPVCGTRVETDDLVADHEFPFCSRRCKLIDLGQWFDGEHRISTPSETEDK